MIFGLSPAFLDGLKRHHGKLPKERKSLVLSFPHQTSSQEDENDSESEEESADESDVEAPAVVHAAPRGRGRGGRGARGGRGRGGRARGRGRGGRPRGSLSRASSPTRSKVSRNAATMLPLEEEDDDAASANQRPSYGAKPSLTTLPNVVPMNSEDEHDNAIAEDDSDMEDFTVHDPQRESFLSDSSPPPEFHESASAGSINSQPAPEPDPGPITKASKPPPVPKTSLPKRLASQSVRNSPSILAETAVPKLLRPEDDVLSETDLPEPWIEDLPLPIEADCEDRADYLLQKRFKPMVDVQDIIASLTKYAISQRSTENLYALAENTQFVLKAWQDQYLMLDARVRSMGGFIFW
jgi:hypothetical protein